MTATGGGTDGREPARAPTGGPHAPAGGPGTSVSALCRQLTAELASRARRRVLPLSLLAAGAALTVLALVVAVTGAPGGAEPSDAAAPSRADVASTVSQAPVTQMPAPEMPAPEPAFPAPELAAPAVRPPVATELPVAPPVSITIADLGIEQNLIGLRVSPDGTMQVPQAGADIGWWAKGPAPGEAGGAVIAGHVSLGGEAAVFSDLDTLADGAEVVVDRSDGSRAVYRVMDRQQFPKDDFPDERVYTFKGPTALHLVTCGGEVDPATGHYKDNVVLFAELVSDTSPTATT